MSTLATRAASLALVLLAGCGAQTVLLGTSGGHLFVGYDQLVTPGEETVLEARLQSGDLLSDRPGHAVSRRPRGPYPTRGRGPVPDE